MTVCMAQGMIRRSTPRTVSALGTKLSVCSCREVIVWIRLTIRPVIIAVTIFHFVYSWNDYFGPLIYLSTKPELQTLGIGLSRFSSQYSARIGYPEAATIMTILIPIVLFIVFQCYFVRGVVVTTGVDK